MGVRMPAPQGGWQVRADYRERAAMASHRAWLHAVARQLGEAEANKQEGLKNEN